MQRIYAEAQELSAEEIERYDALKAEYDKLDADYAKAEDADEAIEAKLDQLGAELDAIDDRPQSYDPTMAREAARLLEGSNWLPEPLRLEADGVDAGDAVADDKSDEAPLDGDAGELPAFLADDLAPPSDKPVTIDSDETDQLQAAE
ncbi:hypothetical protein ACVILI_006768 [Mesorhizobium sp. USDA 4775]